MNLNQVSAGRHIKSALSRPALGRIVLESNRIYIRQLMWLRCYSKSTSLRELLALLTSHLAEVRKLETGVMQET